MSQLFVAKAIQTFSGGLKKSLSFTNIFVFFGAQLNEVVLVDVFTYSFKSDAFINFFKGLRDYDRIWRFVLSG